jgi:hypothetical protein
MLEKSSPSVTRTYFVHPLPQASPMQVALHLPASGLDPRHERLHNDGDDTDYTGWGFVQSSTCL